MNLIKKIKSLQEDKQTFEKEINDKYLIQHKENIGYIFFNINIYFFISFYFIFFKFFIYNYIIFNIFLFIYFYKYDS